MIATALFASLVAIAAASPLSSQADLTSLFPRTSSGCSTSGIASCQNTSAVFDLCCFEAPGVGCILHEPQDTLT